MTAIEDDLVFLDVKADRYVCVRGGARPGAGTCAGALVELIDPDLALELARSGLLEAGTEAPREVGSPVPDPPTASAVPEAAGTLRIADIPEMSRAVADLALTYRGASFEALLRRARRSRARRVAGPATARLADVVARFHRWAPYAPVPAKCLARAFMLLRLLHRHGLDATWVFGVTTWPFAAHCWLQVGDLVLDDDFERLCGFTPILAV